MKRTVVPFRNGIMLAIAAGLAESLEAQSVMLGNHAGDHAIYPDCRAGFVQAMSRAMELGTYARIQLVTPFLTLTKAQIAERGKVLTVPYELTWSCYKGGEKHCGKCGTCVERIEAFEKSGGSDPTSYEVQA
jgi:7-cyano-7-deazaguanine synthase